MCREIQAEEAIAQISIIPLCKLVKMAWKTGTQLIYIN